MDTLHAPAPQPLTHPSPTAPSPTRTPAPGARLTMAGGIAIGAIAVLHVIVMGFAHWPEWLAGSLRDGTASPTSLAAFWAQPGGFEPALIALAIMLVGMARRNRTPPVSVGLVLIGWVGLCVFLLGPFSGFSLGLVAVGLVLAGAIRGRVGLRRAGRAR